MKYAAIFFAIALVSGCVASTNSNNSTLGSSDAEISEPELNQIYENEFLGNRKAFAGPTSNELYDIEVQLKSAGRINISQDSKTDEYFRIDFNVSNHRTTDAEFPYGANITEASFPNVRITNSDEKSPFIGVLKPNETKDGYILFKGFKPENNIIELTIVGGYRPYSTGRINFRFRIGLQNEDGISLEKVPLDFSEEGNILQPGAFLLVKVPSNGTYRYMLTSQKNVSVDIWPPNTTVNTIQFGSSTYNSTCSVKLQTSVTRDCFLESKYIMTVKRTENAKTKDFEGTTLSFYLFRVLPAKDIPGTLKYTGQATQYDISKDSDEVFVVL